MQRRLSVDSITKRYKLPKSFRVSITISKHGFTAELLDYPGCVTHASNFPSLIENVNDAPLTYFDVSREDSNNFGIAYVPQIKTSTSRSQEGKVSKFVPVAPELAYA